MSLADRWQAVGMSQAGFSTRLVAGQMAIQHSEIYHLMQRLQATGMVGELPRSDSPCKATPREDRIIARCARRNRFATSACI